MVQAWAKSVRPRVDFSMCLAYAVGVGSSGSARVTPDGATPMNAYLTERAREIDAQLRAARTTEERRAAISARKLIRGTMEKIAKDTAIAK
jgi:hypothetical protein